MEEAFDLCIIALLAVGMAAFTLVQMNLSRQLLDGWMSDLVQTFMFPRG